MYRCLCCHGTLLRHISQAKIYWYCPKCCQPMPSLVDKSLGLSLRLPQLALAVADDGCRFRLADT